MRMKLAPGSGAAPYAIALVDQRTLLTASTLRLSTELRVAHTRPDRVIVKYQPGRRYLVLTPLQWQALQTFAEGRTVPSVLLELLGHRRSIPLREYYEIVVKAFEAGILQMNQQPLPAEVRPAAWSGRAQGLPARWLALIAMAAASLTIILQPLPLPQHAGHLMLGWLLTCAAISLGNLLAACVLRGTDGDVYQPRLFWQRTLAPRFVADLDDLIMSSRSTQIDVALVRLAPQFALTALAAVYLPGAVLPLLCGLILQLSPLWKSPMLNLLHALYGDVRLATTYDFKFIQNQLANSLLSARLKFTDRRFLLIATSYTALWLVILFLGGCALLQVNPLDLVQRFQDSGGVRITALALLATFGLLAAIAVSLLGWFAWKHLRAWWQLKTAKKRQPETMSVDPDSIKKLLSRTLLFRGLAAADIATLAGAVAAEEHPAGSLVVREAELGEKLYIIFSGRVEVVRELSVGRTEAIATLQEADIFGEIALLSLDGTRRRSVRCVTASVLLSLGKAEFEQLVLSRLSRETIEQTVQKMAFLQRIPLSRYWSPHAVASFARRSIFQEFLPGEIVITEGRENQFFHLIHEGEMRVLKKDKEVAVLTTGQFFGEISLLQNSIATATVVAHSPGRNLLLSKLEFLNFVTQDFVIGLQFEEISSQRLGRPIFPLTGKPDEVPHV
jgi:CRP-like cAMP-binding protein